MEDTGVEAIVEAGRESANAEQRIHAYETGAADEDGDWVDTEAIPLVTHADGSLHLSDEVLRITELRRAEPRQAWGVVHFDELTSFILWFRANQTTCSTIWASQAHVAVTAIIDDDGINEDNDEDVIGWRRNRAIYTCKLSPEWQRWNKINGVQMTQESFADFLDANLSDLASVKDYPTPAAVLEMARNLNVLTKGTFQRIIDPKTGGGQLVCKDEHDPGSTQIPRAFALRLRAFVGSEAWEVEARIRFVVKENKALFTITLHRIDEILTEAFDAVRKKVAEDTDTDVYAGRAPEPRQVIGIATRE